MDLAKAKYVIIALLLVFNLFLLYNNLSYFNDGGVNKETISNAVAILKSRGITLDCSIPANPVKMRRLTYGNGVLDKKVISNQLIGLPGVTENGYVYELGNKKLTFTSDTSFVYLDSKPTSNVNTSNADESGRYARTFLENSGLFNGRKYIVDETVLGKDGTRTIRFIEKFEGYLVFDNYCTVTLNNRGVARLEYSRMQILGFSPEKAKNRISAYQVLLANYQKGSGQVITAIDIGYKYPDGQSFEGVKSSELLPVWRVRMKGTDEVDYLSSVYTMELTAAPDVKDMAIGDAK